jgi:hypothetical protein
MRSSTKISLVAPCGMNCSVCRAYLRDNNRCLGCREEETLKPVSILRCKIRNCTVFQKGSEQYCFKCKEFPCINLKHLDKRYRTRYNTSVIANLENIRDLGIRQFVRNEHLKWTCSQCAGTISVHTGSCRDCGKRMRRVSHPAEIR